MSWDQAYNELRLELGREPDSSEIQQRMLEIAEEMLDRRLRA